MDASAAEDLFRRLEVALGDKDTQDSQRVIDELTDLPDKNAFLKYCDVVAKKTAVPGNRHRESKLDNAKSSGLRNRFHLDSKNKSAPKPDIEICKDKKLLGLITKPGYERVVFALFERRPALIVDEDGNTMLHIVARERLAPLLDLLVYSRWLTNMVSCYNSEGYLPLHLAAVSCFHHFFHLFYPSNLLEVDLCQDSRFCSKDGIDKDLIRSAKGKSMSINTPMQVEECSSFLKISNCVLLCMLDFKRLRTEARASRLAQESLEMFVMLKLLLRLGARLDPSSRSMYPWIPDIFYLSTIHLMASLGSVENTTLLLASGADAGACLGAKFRPAVQLALEAGRSEVSLLLLDSGLYPTPDFLQAHRDKDKNTLFHSAAKGYHGNTAEVYGRLYQLGCPLDRPNKMELRPLDLAISSDHLPTISQLLSLNPAIVNVQMYDDSGAYPPLHRAARCGSLPLCKLLLSYGADINAHGHNKQQVTAYSRAFKFDNPEVGVFLCENSSRPFSMEEIQYLQLQLCSLHPDLASRLENRLANVPSLALTCLDAIRSVFIKNYFSFKHMDSLPLPQRVIQALKYEA